MSARLFLINCVCDFEIQDQPLISKKKTTKMSQTARDLALVRAECEYYKKKAAALVRDVEEQQGYCPDRQEGHVLKLQYNQCCCY